jgi:peroxiredoxin
VKKRVALIFGVLGMIALVMASFLIYRNELFQAYAFCTIAVFASYIFLVYTQSRVAVISILICHIVAIVALYYSGSIIQLSIPYILLPFIALMIRNIWMENLGHTLKLWIEPLFLLVAIALYVIEMKLNRNLISSDARLFPLAYFVANGFMIGDVFYDGIKIKLRIKKGNGLAAGEPAPIFCLQNENDEQICLSDFKEKNNVLLIFVRGEWCPMCHIMLRTYARESAQFRENNVFLLVIGPDPTGVNRKMAEELKLDFQILSDTGLNVTHLYRLKIKAEHLLHANNYNDDKEVPLPASFLIDKKGIIRYSSNPEKIGEVVKLADIFPILQSIEGTKGE